jgi:hypothetical protein
MEHVITSTETVCHAVEAASAAGGINKTTDDFRNLYLEGKAVGAIKNGRLKRIGYSERS